MRVRARRRRDAPPDERFRPRRAARDPRTVPRAGVSVGVGRWCSWSSAPAAFARSADDRSSPNASTSGSRTASSFHPTHSSELALSPDGTLIAYASTKPMGDMPKMASAGRRRCCGSRRRHERAMPPMSMTEQIYVRAVGQGSARPMGGALGSAPFFSPDGKWLGFWHAPTGTLRKVALTGGAPIKICDAVSGIAGALGARRHDRVRVVRSLSRPGVRRLANTAAESRRAARRAILPASVVSSFGKGRFCSRSAWRTTTRTTTRRSACSRSRPAKKKILVQGGTSPRYSPSGHLIYARAAEGSWRCAFDPDKLEVIGQPFPVVDGLFMSANTGMAAYSISSDGHLVYAAGPEERGTRVPVWVDQKRPAIAAARCRRARTSIRGCRRTADSSRSKSKARRTTSSRTTLPAAR